jgi:hypothetical protein
MLQAMTARRRLISAVAVVTGVALLAWQVRETGLDNITRGMAAVGWLGSAAILALSLFRFAARSTGWSALIPTDTPPGRALAAMIAGEAAGSLTPLSLIVSEPAKAAYLGASMPSVGTSGALAALVAETFFFGVSIAIYVTAGAAALLFAYPVDASLRAAGLAALGGMAVALAVAALMAWHKPTVVGAALARVPVRGASRLAERVRVFERSAYGTTTHVNARLGVVIASATAFHALSFLEMWLTLWLVTGESHPAAAFVLDTVGRLTNVLFKVIPLQLGVLQVGSELVARAIGLPAGVGVTVSLIRTVRVLFWSGIGLGLLGRTGWGR